MQWEELTTQEHPHGQPGDRSGDLITEFFAVFLGVWASFVLTQQGFSIWYGSFVLVVTTLAVYLLINALTVQGLDSLERWVMHYLPAVLGAIGAAIVIHWSSIYLFPSTQGPSFEHVSFLAVIMALWILIVEFTRFRQARLKQRLWRQP